MWNGERIYAKKYFLYESAIIGNDDGVMRVTLDICTMQIF